MGNESTDCSPEPRILVGFLLDPAALCAVTDEILNFYILLCLALACAAIVMLTD